MASGKTFVPWFSFSPVSTYNCLAEFNSSTPSSPQVWYRTMSLKNTAQTAERISAQEVRSLVSAYAASYNLQEAIQDDFLEELCSSSQS